MCPPVVKGSAAGGFMTLVWSAESEFVLLQLGSDGGDRYAELYGELSTVRFL